MTLVILDALLFIAVVYLLVSSVRFAFRKGRAYQAKRNEHKSNDPLP